VPSQHVVVGSKSVNGYAIRYVTDAAPRLVGTALFRKPKNMRHDHPGNVFPWLEVVVGISVLGLLFELFPSLWQGIDVRNWSRMTALIVNVAAVIILVGIRTGPNLIAVFLRRRNK